MLHHDVLKPCGDRAIPLWMRRLHRRFLQSLPVDDTKESDYSGMEDLFNLNADTACSDTGTSENQITEQDNSVKESIDHSDSSSEDEESQKFHQGRLKRLPIWMRDYAS